MKSLSQSLIDYETALLKAIANCRAVPLNTSSQNEMVDQLVDNLLSPVATAIVLGDLSKEETDALQFLVEHGGQIEGPRFTRQYGVVRSMGPARMERDRPWQNPANPAEGLWYRGLIFKAFQVTTQGGSEVIYIPSDVLPLLAQEPVKSAAGGKAFEVALSPQPTVVVSGTGRLRENIFSLLVYLQTTPVRVQPKSDLADKDKQALIQCLLPPLFPAITSEAELDFLLHLGQRAELLTVTHGRLKPERNAVRSWLQAEPVQQSQQLQNTWRADPTWNDLWHVSNLVPQTTGWENSPLRARSKILGCLEQIETSAGEWLSIEDFVQGIKRTDPDFQRPNGDYESWYIQDAQGNFLMGFEHWGQVEGALIHYLLTHVLPLLGVIDLGYAMGSDAPTAFCITPLGQAFLTEQPLVETSPERPAYLRVNEKFHVRVPAKASLYDRFQLARFAQLNYRENKKVVYHITKASVNRAVKNGVTVDQITAFLTRATNNQIPLKVVETLRNWGTRYATAKLEQATILRLENEQLVVELRRDPAINRLIGEQLGPSTILVSAKNVAELRRLLTEAGYLE